MQVGTADVFRALASSLPAWVMPAASGWQAAAPASPALDAMRRMVAEAGDPLEAAGDFRSSCAPLSRDSMKALCRRRSRRSRPRSCSSAKRRSTRHRRSGRRKGDEAFDADRLKVAAESPAQHPSLRKLLGFFTALSPAGLLDQLGREDKRERRRLLLALLEAHGPAAREAAFEALAAPFREVAVEEWYLRRNCLYLLRKIPRPAEAPLEAEVEVTVRHAELRLPPLLLREAVANLGTLRHENRSSRSGSSSRDSRTRFGSPRTRRTPRSCSACSTVSPRRSPASARPVRARRFSITR